MPINSTYSEIVVNGDTQDRDILFKLFKQRGSSNNFSKTNIRQHLIREFMGSCIFNEANKEKHKFCLEHGLFSSYEDRNYWGLRHAIFWLGFTWDQIDNIEDVCVKLADKYYPKEPKDKSKILPSSIWTKKRIYKRPDELVPGQKFRWFESDNVPIYVFIEISENKIVAKCNKTEEIKEWKNYNRKLAYIELDSD